MFKRPATHYGKSPQPETPYQRAAQVWDERIGSARVQARNWRFMAFGSLALSMGLSAALVWQSANGSIVPWVVQVDRLGQAQAVAPATADYQPNDPQIAFYLARFIEQVRSIPADAIIVRQNWLRAYDFTTQAARWRSTTTPGERPLRQGRQAAGRGRGVERHPRLAVELPRRLDRAPLSGRRARLHRTLVRHPHRRRAAPRDADTLRKNPLGIYVNAINWSKELGQ
jgi:type IV secretion system protein VirB5